MYTEEELDLYNDYMDEVRRVITRRNKSQFGKHISLFDLTLGHIHRDGNKYIINYSVMVVDEFGGLCRWESGWVTYNCFQTWLSIRKQKNRNKKLKKLGL